ncbi:MAG TPA: sulfate permease, partial [Rhodoglobus sp.]|nr:sulfate permease [Rhodoglobus sp.]
LWACWNALKFIIMGPVSVALLIRARLREAAVHRHQRHDSRGEASLREPALRV